jgi:hypothetical protein
MVDDFDRIRIERKERELAELLSSPIKRKS